MTTLEDPFHPDLRTLARWFPRFTFSRPLMRVMRALGRLQPAARAREGLRIEDVHVAGPERAPAVRVRTYRPTAAKAPVPALLWMHGGGFVIGAPEQDDGLCMSFASKLGIVVASVDYRLAPEHPFPAPLEDCYAALRWLFSEPGVRSDRIAVGGASAGGGLAAALAQLAHDRKALRPAFQLLVYPMVDDRTVLRTDIDGRHHRGWNHASNIFGWSAYLGRAPGGADTPPHAAPARRESLVGLPPAWVGVGALDLFHDEDVAYARRLEAAGVPCELVTVPGAFHGFDLIARKAGVSREFRAAHTEALRRALRP